MGAFSVIHTPDTTELHGYMGIEIRQNTPAAAKDAGWGDGYFGRPRIGAYADYALRAEYHRGYNQGSMERGYN